MSGDLVPLQPKPVELTRLASDAAGACKEIVLRTAQKIGGRKYVRVEGWQAIANAYGCVASARDIRRVDGGWAATGEVRRGSDGVLLTTAEGFVGEDECTWMSRPEYARRAMAQTRAISRACRSAFAFVVVLMDAGLETTPAEEVGDEDGREPKDQPTEGLNPSKEEKRTAMAALHAKGAELGIHHEELSQYACDRYSVGSMASLAVPRLREVYRALTNGTVAEWLIRQKKDREPGEDDPAEWEALPDALEEVKT